MLDYTRLLSSKNAIQRLRSISSKSLYELLQNQVQWGIHCIFEASCIMNNCNPIYLQFLKQKVSILYHIFFLSSILSNYFGSTKVNLSLDTYYLSWEYCFLLWGLHPHSWDPSQNHSYWSPHMFSMLPSMQAWQRILRQASPAPFVTLHETTLSSLNCFERPSTGWMILSAILMLISVWLWVVPTLCLSLVM